MKKSKGPVIPISMDESLEQMRSTLVAEGYMLPTQAEELSEDDLLLYGQGQPRSFASLQRKAKARMSHQTANKPYDTTQQSMAMAARNGQKISKNVWSQMQKDRLCSENRTKNNE